MARPEPMIGSNSATGARLLEEAEVDALLDEAEQDKKKRKGAEDAKR